MNFLQNIYEISKKTFNAQYFFVYKITTQHEKRYILSKSYVSNDKIIWKYTFWRYAAMFLRLLFVVVSRTIYKTLLKVLFKRLRIDNNSENSKSQILPSCILWNLVYVSFFEQEDGAKLKNYPIIWKQNCYLQKNIREKNIIWHQPFTTYFEIWIEFCGLFDVY